MSQEYGHFVHNYLLKSLILPHYATALEPLVWQTTWHKYEQESEQNLLCSPDTLFNVLMIDVCQQLIHTIEQALKREKLPDFLNTLSLEQANDIVDIYYWKTKQFGQLMQRHDSKIQRMVGRFMHQYPALQTYKADIYQETVLLLWEQLNLNKLARFEGASLFSTFFHTVIRWMLIRAVKRLQPIEQKMLDIDVWEHAEQLTKIDLADHQANEVYASLLPQHVQTVQHFTLTLKSNDRNKLLFSWQLLYNVPFATPSDVQQYYPHCSSDLFLDILLVQQQKNTKEQIFECLSLFIKQLTYSEINKDALKKWLNRKRQMAYSLLFDEQLVESKSSEINAYWELLMQRFFAEKLVS